MRKPGKEEHKKIKTILLKDLKSEKLDNIVAFGCMILMLIVFAIGFVFDTSATIPVPYFLCGTVILAAFFAWILFIVVKELNGFISLLENKNYEIEDVTADEFHVYMETPKSAKKLSVSIKDKTGNTLEVNCKILNKLNYNDYDKFKKENKSKRCLYIKLADNCTYTLF